MFIFILKKDIKYKLYFESKSFPFSEKIIAVWFFSLVSWKAWVKKLETKYIYPWTERFLMWPAGKNNNKKIKSDVTEVWPWLCTNRLRKDGWVCMERSDLLRGVRFTCLKKQWNKMTRDLSDWLTQILPQAETRLLGTELKNDTAEQQKEKFHYKIKHSLVIIFPKIHWII